MMTQPYFKSLKPYFESAARAIEKFCLPPSKTEESAVRTLQAVGLSPSLPMRITAVFLSVIPITLSALGIFGHPIVGFGKATFQLCTGSHKGAPATCFKGVVQSVRSIAQVILLISTAFWGLFSRRFYEVLVEPENEQIKALRDEATTARQTIQDLKNHVEKLNLSIKDLLGQNEKLFKSNQEFNESNIDLQGKLTENTSAETIKKLKEDATFWEAKYIKLETSWENSVDNEDVKKIEKELKTVKEQLETLTTANDELSFKLSQRENTILELGKQNEIFGKSKTGDAEQHKMMLSQITTLEETLKSVEKDCENAKAEIGDLMGINSSLQQEVKEKQQKIEDLKIEKEKYLKNFFQLEKKLKTMNRNDEEQPTDNETDMSNEEVSSDNQPTVTESPKTPPGGNTRQYNSVSFRKKARSPVIQETDTSNPKRLSRSVSKTLAKIIRKFDQNVVIIDGDEQIPKDLTKSENISNTNDENKSE